MTMLVRQTMRVEASHSDFASNEGVLHLDAGLEEEWLPSRGLRGLGKGEA